MKTDREDDYSLEDHRMNGKENNEKYSDGQSDLSDEEGIQELRLAKARAEREELEAKLELAELRRKKRLASRSTSSRSSSTQHVSSTTQLDNSQDNVKVSPSSPGVDDDEELEIAATPSPINRKRQVTTLSPQDRKFLSAEIVKRRKMGEFSSAIANSLRRERTPSHDNNDDEIQVLKSPSPLKVKTRVLLGLDVGRLAKDVTLSRQRIPREDNGVTASIKHGIERAVHEEVMQKTKIQAPTMGLRSTREQNKSSLPRGSIVFGNRTSEKKAATAEKTSFADNYLKSRQKRAQSRAPDSDSDLDIEPPLPSLTSSSAPSSSSSAALDTPPLIHQSAASAQPQEAARPDKSDEVYDPHSNLNLTVRYTPASIVTDALSDKEIVSVSGLYKHIVPPDYDPPAWAEWAVLGIVAKKSSIMYMKKPQSTRRREQNFPPKPLSATEEKKVIERAASIAPDESFRHHQARLRKAKTKAEIDRQNRRADGTGEEDDEDERRRRRYFIITLTDLKVDTDLFICGPQVDKLWKLQLGTLVAVYNPGIWPSKPSDPLHGTSRGFKINLDQPDDEILEIGRARDFAICKALTKKQTPCTRWVCARRTEYCEFHIELAVNRNSSRRADLNKGTPYFAPRGVAGEKMALVRGADGKQHLVSDSLAPRVTEKYAAFKDEITDLGYEMPRRKYQRGGFS
ncbi:uncharacterized protein V2V93DRAFT_369186 [Kockiozyma suomiensis]|uniref:uncharacterized protein n=1 Tax=Kockiozyma suomiensis TaxID=1337062 RepID=UPI0033433CB1